MQQWWDPRDSDWALRKPNLWQLIKRIKFIIAQSNHQESAESQKVNYSMAQKPSKKSAFFGVSWVEWQPKNKNGCSEGMTRTEVDR